MGTNPTAHFIHFTIGGLSELYRQCYNSFKQNHPSYKVILWNTTDVLIHLRDEGRLDEFDKLTSFINRYNFAKYSILNKFGGWYVDLDIMWKRSLDELVVDKFKENNVTDTDLFIPVRSFPREKKRDLKRNDDMLLYSKPKIFGELIDFAKSRTDVDLTKKYEPYGPVSLSMWLTKCSYERIYMFEDEIQKDGRYCNHLNNQGWKYS